MADPILQDPLSAPGVITPYTCQSNKAAASFTPEGLLLTMTGRCNDSQPGPAVGVRPKDITVRDGEVRLEFRTTAGADRALITLWVRDQQTPDFSTQLVRIEPGTGRARLAVRNVGKETELASQQGLTGLAGSDWNSLAIRMQGPAMWVLLNDQLVLTGGDPTFAQGAMNFVVGRNGDPNDAQEVSVLVRNLRVSPLAGGDQGRAPSFIPPCDPIDPLIGGVQITPPDPSLPANLAAYSGTWQGKWNGLRATRVGVESIDAASARLAISIVGFDDGQTSLRPATLRTAAEVLPDARLGFGTNPRTYFGINPNVDSIDGIVDRGGQGISGQITMTRCSP